MRSRKKTETPAGSSEIFEALATLEQEHGISMDFMLDRIKKAIVTACKSSYGNDDCIVSIDPARGLFLVFLNKTVVADVTEPGKEISVEDARNIDPTAVEGEVVSVPIDTKQFGRIAAMTARNIIRQGIRDGERSRMLQEFESKQQEVVSALVDQIDPRTGAATLIIGKSEAVLPKSEQVPGETLRVGDHIKVYIADVKETERGPCAIISRIHPNLVRRLFEAEVPEIYDGTVEIKSVSREAGSRTKIAVVSHNPNVDAVGSCIGAKGMRVNRIVEELGGEKIDIVEYSDDPCKFIASALSPATVVEVVPAKDGSHACRVSVPDEQLSLAIGNKGQNARLAARLTGWKIDIKPQSGFFGETDETEMDEESESEQEEE
ncbi:MAG: Transcription termination/antitermination protein NusA [Thermocaproicibacter melissae]|jgi:transcription termination/antitermination protein NusA|uniref:transcription termination factor NusA n=1 Tax=Thermocaproicibacter melissae TaxID=2966552 RepID=UPI003A101948